MNCTKCGLHQYRRNVVVGRGVLPCDVLFIGEAPNRADDLLGEPFVGLSGKLLDKMIIDAGLTNNYFITNTIFCRPCDNADSENREPSLQERAMCRSNVMRIAVKARPRIVVFIGRMAQAAFRKEFTNHVTIIHPEFVLKKGGVASTFYQHNVNLLKRVNHAEKTQFQIA
jgi:uracil-DNA glycosylase family 4